MSNKSHVHVRPEVMLALLEGKLPKEISQKTGHQIGKCAQCTTELRSIKSILRESALPPMLETLAVMLLKRGLYVWVEKERGR